MNTKTMAAPAASPFPLFCTAATASDLPHEPWQANPFLPTLPRLAEVKYNSLACLLLGIWGREPQLPHWALIREAVRGYYAYGREQAGYGYRLDRFYEWFTETFRPEISRTLVPGLYGRALPKFLDQVAQSLQPFYASGPWSGLMNAPDAQQVARTMESVPAYAPSGIADEPFERPVMELIRIEYDTVAIAKGSKGRIPREWLKEKEGNQGFSRNALSLQYLQNVAQFYSTGVTLKGTVADS